MAVQSRVLRNGRALIGVPGCGRDSCFVKITSIEFEIGILVVGQLDRGPADEVAVPRPGVYDGHAWWVNRQGTSAYYDSTLARLTDDSPETG